MATSSDSRRRRLDVLARAGDHGYGCCARAVDRHVGACGGSSAGHRTRERGKGYALGGGTAEGIFSMYPITHDRCRARFGCVLDLVRRARVGDEGFVRSMSCARVSVLTALSQPKKTVKSKIGQSLQGNFVTVIFQSTLRTQVVSKST